MADRELPGIAGEEVQSERGDHIDPGQAEDVERIAPQEERGQCEQTERHAPEDQPPHL
jgi:hypothetical protein